MDVSNVQSGSYRNRLIEARGGGLLSSLTWSQKEEFSAGTDRARLWTTSACCECFCGSVIRSWMKHLWDVTSCSAKGGAVLHQRAFTKKNVETLRPINATASVIPVSNLLPLCGNNFRVYKRVRFLPSACAVRAQPRFTPKLRVQPGAAARGSCDYRLSNASAGFFEAAWWTAAIARIRARNVSE